MKSLTSTEFNLLIQDASILEEDGYGLKVLKLHDGTFLKLFRRKRWISSALFYPYGRRFAENAGKLSARNIQTLTVIEQFRISTPPRYCVHYQPLPGTTLRDLYRKNESPMPKELVKQLGSYIAELHQKGVYFRSMHLGNIVQTPDGSLGIIDISDLKIFHAPLKAGLRIRNFSHLIKGELDYANLNPNSSLGTILVESYCSATDSITKATLNSIKAALGKDK